MEHGVHGLRYRLGLLVAASAIIVIGIALKPQEKNVAPITEIESARLRRLTQERRLQELGEYISYAAQIAAKSLVYLPALDQTAVALDRHTVATGVRHIDAPAIRATSSSRPIEMKLQARRPDVPILFLRPADNSSVPAAPRAEVDTGDWVIAVALREDATPVFAYALYENSAESRCGSHTYTRLRASIPLTPAFIGGGLFSLRGSLAGIIARCGPEIVVLSVGSVASALSRPVAPNDWLQDRYGLRVEAAGAALRAVAVWNQSPAEVAGVRPGDSIAKVDERDVETPSDAVEALDADNEHELTLHRGRRTVRVRIALAPAPGETHVPEAGLTLVDSAEGLVVRSVRAESPAARAGLLAGDRITRLGGKPAGSGAAVATAPISESRPLVLTVERGGTSFDARVAP